MLLLVGFLLKRELTKSIDEVPHKKRVERAG